MLHELVHLHPPQTRQEPLVLTGSRVPAHRPPGLPGHQGHHAVWPGRRRPRAARALSQLVEVVGWVLVDGPEGQRRSALLYGPLEQAPGVRAQHVESDASGPCRLTERRDSGRVAPEGPDVVLDPFQGQRLVKQAVVSGHDLVAGGQETEDSQSVLYDDNDDVTVCDEFGGCVSGSAAAEEPSTVDPNHDRAKSCKL